MANDMIVKEAKTRLMIDGKEFPILSYELSLAVNSLPQLSMSIPMGFSMTADGMGSEPVDVSAIEEGSEVLFGATVGDMSMFFEGVVKRSGLDIKISSIANSQGVYTLEAESALSALGGLPTKDRIFMGNGPIPQNSIDTYRDVNLKLSSKKPDQVLARLLEGSAIEGDINTTSVAAGGKSSLPNLIIQVIKLLYRSEARGSSGRRNKDTAALVQLGLLQKNIKGGVLKRNSSMVEGRSRIVRAMLEGLVKAWEYSNGLNMLVKSMGSIFFSLTPNQDGMVYLQQYCPVYSKEKYTIPNSDILSIHKTDTYNANPITGIRMVLPNDRFYHKNLRTGSGMYITYPDKGPGGLYKYIEGSTFDMWLSFISAYDPQKEKESKASAVRQTGRPGGKNKSEGVKKGNKKAKETEEESRTALKLSVGKAVYALEKWKNNGIVIQVAWSPDINPGDIVKIDLTKNAGAIAEGIPLGVYYGYVHALRLQGREGGIYMTVSLSHIRNEKDNKEFGFEEYPMYEKAKE